MPKVNRSDVNAIRTSIGARFFELMSRMDDDDSESPEYAQAMMEALAILLAAAWFVQNRSATAENQAIESLAGVALGSLNTASMFIPRNPDDPEPIEVV